MHFIHFQNAHFFSLGMYTYMFTSLYSDIEFSSLSILCDSIFTVDFIISIEQSPVWNYNT